MVGSVSDETSIYLESLMTPKLLIEDITDCAHPNDIRDGLVKMEHVYIFDDEVRVHCASLTASLECTFLYVAYEFRDDVSDRVREAICEDNGDKIYQ